MNFGRLVFNALTNTRYIAAVKWAMTVTFYGMIVSALWTVMVAAGFVPQTGIPQYVFVICASLYSVAAAIRTLQIMAQGLVYPLRNGKGEVMTGSMANARCTQANPPYKETSLAAEGRIAPDTQLARVYNPAANSKMESEWTMLKSDLQGLSPKQIQARWCLPAEPTHVVDVDATGIRARTGIPGANFGYPDGKAIQIQLLERGASFTNPRPISQGGSQ